MAIVLYKPGNTHTVRGVECEVGRFEVNELQNALELGWVKRPEDTLEGGSDDDNSNAQNPSLTTVEQYIQKKASAEAVTAALNEMKLPELKEEAKRINVKFAANIGEEKLREKIREALDA